MNSLASHMLRFLEDDLLSLRYLIARVNDRDAETVYSCLKRLWKEGFYC